MTDAKQSEPLALPGRSSYGEDWLGYLDAPIERQRTVSVLVSAAVVGLAFDLAMRSGVAAVGGALAIAVTAALLVSSGRLRSASAYALVAAAPLFGVWLAIRTSKWLIPLDILAASGLIALGASFASGGSVWDLRATGGITRALQAFGQGLLGPAFLLRSPAGTSSRSRYGAVIRGVALALPVVVVLGVLLASADAVFASFVDFDAPDFAQHIVLIAIGALGMAALLRLASLRYVTTPQIPRPRLSITECAVVLGALNVLLGAFAAARIVALTEGGQRVIRSAGLTYAEYARSGFFQLLGAAILTVAALLALRAVADIKTSRERALFVSLAIGVVVLTLAMVVSAFHRVVLYEGVFGLTMLRLYVQTAIVWIGIVLVMIAVRVAQEGSGRAWLVGASGASALALLFALNVMNPEAFVARHNIAHEHRPAPFDAPYLSALGDDAIPALASDPGLKDSVCATSGGGPKGWAGYNLARHRARDIRVRLCERGD